MLQKIKKLIWLLSVINLNPITKKNKILTLSKIIITFLILLLRRKMKVNWINNIKFYINGIRDFSSIFNYFFILFDYEEMKFISKLNSNNIIFIDIGANVGIYSMLASALNFKKIFAFEPNTFVFGNLYKNIKLNSLRVTLENKAVGSKLTKVNISKNLNDQNFVTNTKKLNIETEEVECVTIDSLNFFDENLFIKIDVEGYEYEVLKGLTNTFFKNKNIIILIELNKNHSNTKNIFNFLKNNNFVNFGYKVMENQIYLKKYPNLFNEFFTNNFEDTKKMISNKNSRLNYKGIKI